MYSTAMEALRKKERQDENSLKFTTKIAAKTSLDPSYFFL
jgi:hypothetical protein